MGQYYKIVNLERGIELGKCCAKLTEFSWKYNDACLGLVKLLQKKWKGNRIVVAGDYSNQFTTEVNNSDGEPETESLYTMAEKFKKIYYNPLTNRFKEGEYKNSIYKFLRNKEEEEKIAYFDSLAEELDKFYQGLAFYSINKKEFIDLGEYFKKEANSPYREADQWIEHPVPLLLATEHGGGGDYNGVCDEEIGRFTGDNVGVCELGARVLTGMKDITYDISFNEEEEDYKPEKSELFKESETFDRFLYNNNLCPHCGSSKVKIETSFTTYVILNLVCDSCSKRTRAVYSLNSVAVFDEDSEKEYYPRSSADRIKDKVKESVLGSLIEIKGKKVLDLEDYNHIVEKVIKELLTAEILEAFELIDSVPMKDIKDCDNSLVDPVEVFIVAIKNNLLVEYLAELKTELGFRILS